MKKKLFYSVYSPATKVYRILDRIAAWKETAWLIKHLPNEAFTSATYNSYAGLLFHQGLFSGILSTYVPTYYMSILDFGCGYGSLVPVLSFFVRNHGVYTGIDVDKRAIKACKKTYEDLPHCYFFDVEDYNPFYSSKNKGTLGSINWPVEELTQDVVIASSVFTHMKKYDAIRHVDKVYSVLKVGGILIASFLIVRPDHTPSNPTYDFKYFLTPGWYTSDPECPEHSIGITKEALDYLLNDRFSILLHIEGQFTGGKHPSLQDIYVLKKL